MSKKTVKAPSTSKKAIAAEMKKDPRIECIYEEEITFMCPVRGLVKQKVKIKRYKAPSELADKHIIAPGNAIDTLEKEDDGLSIYKEGDLEVEG